MSDFLPYGRHQVNGDDVAAVVSSLESDWLTQGPRAAAFEKSVAEYCGVKNAVAVSSGTAALHVACLAAGVGPGDEVITSTNTFVASANCALYCGADARLIDVDAETFNMDPSLLAEAITPQTKVVIPVHFAGHPCDMERIGAIARDKGVTVIEDACHALGAVANGRRVGSCDNSDMTVLSFHPVKHITTGEGGMILTNSDDLAEKLRMLANHGIIRDPELMEDDAPDRGNGWFYQMVELGYNYRITDIQSALGESQMKRLDTFLDRRREIAATYGTRLASIPGISLPSERAGVSSAWHLYVVHVDDASRRADVFRALREAGIGVQVHYIPVHYQPYYRNRYGWKRGDLPQAERHYASAITIPLHPGMTDEDVERVAVELERAVCAS